jgi:cardiolipin synthase A/B
VKLLIQPEDGIAPLVDAIKKAKKSVDVVIFRFDRAEMRPRSRLRPRAASK